MKISKIVTKLMVERARFDQQKKNNKQTYGYRDYFVRTGEFFLQLV